MKNKIQMMIMLAFLPLVVFSSEVEQKSVFIAAEVMERGCNEERVITKQDKRPIDKEVLKTLCCPVLMFCIGATAVTIVNQRRNLPASLPRDIFKERNATSFRFDQGKKNL